MTFRYFTALAIATVLECNSTPAPPAALGVVTEANRAHLDRSEVSAGTTVYDGDHFSTEPSGMLQLRGNAITLELAEASSALVRNKTSGAQGTQAELTTGTLIFTATRADALQVEALDARISPLADTTTIAQVSMAGSKELRIYARRGSLLISYRGETKTITEGTAFRVILDSPDDHPGNAGTRKAGRQPRPVVLIAVGAGAAGAALLVH